MMHKIKKYQNHKLNIVLQKISNCLRKESNKEDHINIQTGIKSSLAED